MSLVGHFPDIPEKGSERAKIAERRQPALSIRGAHVASDTLFWAPVLQVRWYLADSPTERRICAAVRAAIIIPVKSKRMNVISRSLG